MPLAVWDWLPISKVIRLLFFQPSLAKVTAFFLGAPELVLTAGLLPRIVLLSFLAATKFLVFQSITLRVLIAFMI